MSFQHYLIRERWQNVLHHFSRYVREQRSVEEDYVGSTD